MVVPSPEFPRSFSPGIIFPNNYQKVYEKIYLVRVDCGGIQFRL